MHNLIFSTNGLLYLCGDRSVLIGQVSLVSGKDDDDVSGCLVTELPHPRDRAVECVLKEEQDKLWYLHDTDPGGDDEKTIYKALRVAGVVMMTIRILMTVVGVQRQWR